MTKKFAITAASAQRATAPSDTAPAMERFIAGVEPLTTVTVQLPTRLKRALKQQALDRDTSVKNLLVEILDTHFAQTP